MNCEPTYFCPRGTICGHRIYETFQEQAVPHLPFPPFAHVCSCGIRTATLFSTPLFDRHVPGVFFRESLEIPLFSYSSAAGKLFLAAEVAPRHAVRGCSKRSCAASPRVQTGREKGRNTWLDRCWAGVESMGRTPPHFVKTALSHRCSWDSDRETIVG